MYRYLIALSAVCLLGVLPAAAQDAPPLVDIDTQFQTLEDTAVTLRGLETLEAVTRGFPTRDDVRAYVEESLALSLSDETVTEMTVFYEAFDFIAPGTNLRDVFNELYSQQIAGYYDPETKEMNVVSMFPSDDQELGLLDKIVYVHEYTHALQDQHFDLDAYLKEVEDTDNSDLSLARISLVEGDATFVMNDFAVTESRKDPLGSLLELATATTQAGGMSLPADTPKIIGDELLFPYLNGESFVRALLADGGLDRLNEAYSNPPTSTEQIMHPELYLQRQEPLPLVIPTDPTPPAEGWSVASKGVLGEFYLRSYLNTQLTSAEANAGAAGWGNGGYVIYRNGDQLAWTLILVWDTPADKAEFETLFHKFAAARTDNETIDNSCYASSMGESLCMTSMDSGTLILYGPTLEIISSLRENIQP